MHQRHQALDLYTVSRPERLKDQPDGCLQVTSHYVALRRSSELSAHLSRAALPDRHYSDQLEQGKHLGRNLFHLGPIAGACEGFLPYMDDESERCGYLRSSCCLGFLLSHPEQTDGNQWHEAAPLALEDTDLRKKRAQTSSFLRALYVSRAATVSSPHMLSGTNQRTLLPMVID